MARHVCFQEILTGFCYLFIFVAERVNTMRLVDNNKREQLHFEIFRDRYGLDGKYEHGDCPDYTGSFDGGVLGIEFTELYRQEKTAGMKPREHEMARFRIVEKACQKAIQAGLPPLHVYVHFAGNVAKEREGYLINSLFWLVANHIPEPQGVVSLDYKDGVPDDINAITIANIPGPKTQTWISPECGFVDNDFAEQLQEALDSKDVKLKQYLTKCDQCWLVVVTLGLCASSLYEFGEKMTNTIFRSSFEKVFFMEVNSEVLQELKITKG